MVSDAVNLDAEIARIGGDIYISRMEVENWNGGVEAYLLAKTANMRESFIKAGKAEIAKRGWGEKSC